MSHRFAGDSYLLNPPANLRSEICKPPFSGVSPRTSWPKKEKSFETHSLSRVHTLLLDTLPFLEHIAYQLETAPEVQCCALRHRKDDWCRWTVQDITTRTGWEEVQGLKGEQKAKQRDKNRAHGQAGGVVYSRQMESLTSCESVNPKDSLRNLKPP